MSLNGESRFQCDYGLNPGTFTAGLMKLWKGFTLVAGEEEPGKFLKKLDN